MLSAMVGLNRQPCSDGHDAPAAMPFASGSDLDPRSRSARRGLNSTGGTITGRRSHSMTALLQPRKGEFNAQRNGILVRQPAASEGEERRRADHRGDDRHRSLVRGQVAECRPHQPVDVGVVLVDTAAPDRYGRVALMCPPRRLATLVERRQRLGEPSHPCRQVPRPVEDLRCRDLNSSSIASNTARARPPSSGKWFRTVAGATSATRAIARFEAPAKPRSRKISRAALTIRALVSALGAARRPRL